MADNENTANIRASEHGSSIWPLYALLAIAAIALVVLQLRRPAASNQFVGRALPVLDAAGWINSDQSLTTGDLRGKVVLLDFWATWCGPCRAELPTLIKLKDRFRDQGLTVVGLTNESNENELVKQFVESVPGMDWPIGYGAAMTMEQMGVQWLPTYVLFDRTGRSVWGGSELGSAEDAIVAALARP